jgi:penicillin-binding protein 2B
MIQALTTLTNDGVELKPYVIDKVVNPNNDKIIYQSKKNELEKVYSTSTINKMIELMDATVNSDDKTRTGKPYHSDSVRIIGKTGTANYTDASGNYLTDTYKTIRSFAGVFPKENPEYIIYLAVKDFQGSTQDMGHAVKQAVESISKYKNIDNRTSDADETKIVNINNFTNKDINVTIEALKTVKLNPIVIGNGTKVVSQYPKKGTTVSAGTKVFIITNDLTYTMPDMTGWSSTEFVDFCNLIGVEYKLNGYGYVTSTNVAPGSVIDITLPIEATCTTIDPASLVTTRE